MDPISNKAALASAGAAGGDSLYVDDVFSTDLYEGSSNTATITNGIDLSGEGGMVWIKNRSNTRQHSIYDSERELDTRLAPNLDSAEQDLGSVGQLVFNSNGLSIPSGDGDLNGNGFGDQVAWTFRKAPGFFDVVTYTGDGTANRAIAHGLGSVPGVIIVKCTSNSGTSWAVYHRSIGTQKALQLNTTSAVISSSLYFPTTPTSSQFFVSDDTANFNASGRTYVAYIFAHDDQSFGTDGDEAIIKCGSYSGTASNGNFVDLGFEPQWVLTKNTSRSADWSIWDNMRGVMTGWSSSADNDVALHPNNNYADTPVGNVIDFNSTGFTLNSGSDLTNWVSGDTFIYVAIRRPHKPPTAGTEVFDDVAYTGNASSQDISISPSIADTVLIKRRTAADNWGWANRLTGKLQHLTPNSTAAEATRNAADAVEFDRHNAFGLVGNSSGEVNASGETLISYSFKRAPGFFDVVTYTGDGTYDESHVVNHNLGVAPEMIIAKNRDSSNQWCTYHTALTDSGYQIYLNNTSSEGNVAVDWNPTATTFTPQGSGSADSNSNSSGDDYIAFLFATLPGISKVGSYTGTGSNIDVDCGFTSGARFVLIKQVNAYANWYIYDSARGIVSGNDTYLLMTASSETTPGDYIDPLNSGFTVTSNADFNTSGATYLFLAIA